MLLVIAAFFAVGGAVLVNGSFMDRLSAAAEQEQSMHAMLCGVVEDYYLDQTGRGEDTCGDDFITAATWRAGDLARGVYSQGLFRASADPAQDEAYAIYGLQDGQSILQYGPGILFGLDNVRYITADKTDRMVLFITPEDIELFMFFTAVVGNVRQCKFVALRFSSQLTKDHGQRKILCHILAGRCFNIGQAELVQRPVEIVTFIGRQILQYRSAQRYMPAYSAALAVPVRSL